MTTQRGCSNAVDTFEIKALTFDVFGTVVDWRSSIIRKGTQLGEDRGVEVGS